jgi:hypothetical protein
MNETINVPREKVEWRLTREQAVKATVKEKSRFVPREGFRIRFPNGIVYRVISTNVGQLRFTALFDGVVAMGNSELPKESDSPVGEVVGS